MGASNRRPQISNPSTNPNLGSNLPESLGAPLLNLRGRPFTPPETGYYNLLTGRVITVRRPDLEYDDLYRVAGSREAIVAFYERNHLRRQGECGINTAGSLLFAETDEIAQVPTAYLERLCDFSLAGLRTRGRVLQVIDGDTIRIAAYLPIDFLVGPRFRIAGREVGASQVALGTPNIQGGLYISLVCRLNHIDAAESNTIQGQVASRVLRDKFAETNNLVYCDFEEFDKYGRVLGSFFSDPFYRASINFYMLGYRDPQYGAIAVAYSGGTKSEAMTSLPVYRKGELRGALSNTGEMERGGSLNFSSPLSPSRLSAPTIPLRR